MLLAAVSCGLRPHALAVERLIITQKYPENFPKVTRKFHVFLPEEEVLFFSASDAVLCHIPATALGGVWQRDEPNRATEKSMAWV
jgi:hypothetical protein